MCSSIIMENYQGDLTDIVRASGSGGGAYGVVIGSTTTSSSSELPSSTIISTTTSHHHHHHHSNDLSWHQQQHLSSSDSMNFSSVVLEASTNFGDPFSTMKDPFLQELLMPSGSPYFSSSSGALEEAAASFGAPGGNISTNTSGTSNSASSVFGGHKINNVEEHNDMRRPCKNIFSNMIQISPSAKFPYDSQPMAPSPRPIKPSALLSPNMASKDSLLDTSGLQISSPRNPGLKRRKNLAKKVVCIPAPAAANSRQTGEVVPSDLWAWRKYGQKPIKGSPYPRGYYRCSSSKGCSARKQVERSRTDPNMLVITYTSEHNHPWPTQRNALAGSARSQASKNNNNNNNNNASNSKNSSESNQKGTTTTTKKAKEEQHQEMSNNTSEGNVSPVANSVKEENMEEIEKQLGIEMDEGEFSDGLPYMPCMTDQSNNNSEDFFAELGEIDADPLHLLFTQGFGAADDNQRESKALDPFQLFDWPGDTNNSSFEEPNKRRL